MKKFWYALLISPFATVLLAAMVFKIVDSQSQQPVIVDKLTLLIDVNLSKEIKSIIMDGIPFDSGDVIVQKKATMIKFDGWMSTSEVIAKMQILKLHPGTENELFFLAQKKYPGFETKEWHQGCGCFVGNEVVALGSLRGNDAPLLFAGKISIKESQYSWFFSSKDWRGDIYFIAFEK